MENGEHEGVSARSLAQKIRDNVSATYTAAPSTTLLDYVPFLLAALAYFFYAYGSIFQHVRFGSTAYDLGIFDQTIWGYSNFEIINNTVRGIPNLLGGHCHPILMSLAPLYWIWDDVRMILIAQSTWPWTFRPRRSRRVWKETPL